MTTKTINVANVIVGLFMLMPAMLLAIVPNDQATCIYSVPSGTAQTLKTVKTSTGNYYYDIQGSLSIENGGQLNGSGSTNWLHGVSADKPAKVVAAATSGGVVKFGSDWNAVLACDGYLAQPAIDITANQDQFFLYRVDVLPTAKPVDERGNLLATNEIMHIRSNGAANNCVSMYEIRNYSSIPVLAVTDGAPTWQMSYSTGFQMENNHNHYSTVVNGEIILRSTVSSAGKKYPILYYVAGNACPDRNLPFPHPNEVGKLTIDGEAGLQIRAKSQKTFGTVIFKKSYDSGNIEWTTKGECLFENVIVRPEVDDALPYADDHVVTVGLTRHASYDWSAVTDWTKANGCLDVNGKTVKVGRLYTENGAVVTNFTGTVGTLVFGSNNLESGFRGTATAGTVLRKTGSASMLFGDSEIDTLEVEEGTTGKLMADGAATVRVKNFYVGGVKMSDGVYSQVNIPSVIGGALLVLVGDYEPTYWVGGASGEWQVASNWSANKVPGSGDYVIFTNVVTSITSQGDADVDISPNGIVVECRAGEGESTGVALDLSFAGSGCLYKAGAKLLRYLKPQKHSGGTVVTAGLIYANTSDVGKYGWGTGQITLDRRGGSDPYVYVYNPDHILTNEVKILGSFTDRTKQSITLANDGGELLGKITAEDDFTVLSAYVYDKYSRLYCDVDAPGKTLYVKEPGFGTSLRMTGIVNCSVDTFSVPPLTNPNGYSRHVNFRFDGTNTEVDANLILRDFTNEFSRAAVWAGTNIVLRLATKDGQAVTDIDGRIHTTTLILRGENNLSPDAVVHIGENCHLDIANGVKVSVKECYVGGVALKPGTYSSAKLPNVILGGGRLRVGDGGMIIVVR